MEVVTWYQGPVDFILKLLGQGTNIEETLNDYPHLNKEDIKAALLYGAEIITNEDVFATSFSR